MGDGKGALPRPLCPSTWSLCWGGPDRQAHSSPYPQKLEEQDRRALSIKEQLQREHRFLKRRLEQLSVQSLERVRTDSTGSAVSTDDSEQGGDMGAALTSPLGTYFIQPLGGKLGGWGWPGRWPGEGVGMAAVGSRCPWDSVSLALSKYPVYSGRSDGMTRARHRGQVMCPCEGQNLAQAGQCALGSVFITDLQTRNPVFPCTPATGSDFERSPGLHPHSV